MVRKWFLDKDEPLEVVPVAMSESPIDKVGKIWTETWANLKILGNS